MATLSFDEAKKFAQSGGFQKYGSVENYMAQNKVPTPPAQTTQTPTATATPGIPKPATASVPTPPATGYGGGNYNDLSYDDRVKMQNDAERIKNDPAFRQSEIDRTLSVIKNREGQDVSAQNDYLYRVLGYQAPKVPSPPVQTAAAATTPNMAYNVGSNADREAEARRRLETALNEKRRISEQQKAGLAQNFAKIRTTINEDRALENVQNQRNLNPFSGRSDYAQGMIAMQRERSDREMAQDLATRQANVDQLLADYENASETERQRIVDELTRMDRDFGLQQGQLTGYYNGGRTLAGTQADRDYELGLGQLTGNVRGTPTLAARQFEYQQQRGDRDYNYQVGRDQVADNRWQQQFDYQQIRDSISDQRYQAEFEQNASRWGAEYALKKAVQDQQISDEAANRALRERELSLREGQFNYEKDQAGKPNTNAYINQFNSLYLTKDPYSGETKVANTEGLRRAIIGLNLPDEETDKLLLYYGLPIN